MARNFSKREVSEFNSFRALFQRMVCKFVFFPFFKFFYRFEVIGKENIPTDRSFIVAANHLSHFDPPMIATALRRPVAFMAKKELFEVPVIRHFIDWLGAFAVNREKLEIATIKTAKAAISTKKWIMALFPQGGRDLPSGKIRKLTQGVAYLAKATKAEILPVSIENSDNYKFWTFQSKIVIKIGKPLPVPTDLDESMDQWAKAIVALNGFEYDKEEIAALKVAKEPVK